jgi:hypothetical protein
MAGTWLKQILDRKDDLGSRIILAVVAFVLTTLLGGVVTLLIRRYELDRKERDDRVVDVRTLAKTLFTRITQAELVMSSLKRGKVSEAKDRKKDYDTTYVAWNGDIMGAYLLMGKLSGSSGCPRAEPSACGLAATSGNGSKDNIVCLFEDLVECQLKKMDAILTDAIDNATKESELAKLPSQPVQCSFRKTREELRACSLVIVEVLNQRAGELGAPSELTEAQLKDISNKCHPQKLDRDKDDNECATQNQVAGSTE